MNHPPIITAECFKKFPDVRFGMSTRSGGVSAAPFGMNLSYNVGDTIEHVEKNRQLFFASLEINQEDLAIPKQVHSANVEFASGPGSYPACDGLVTDRRGVFLCVSVADCVPVFLYETKNHVVAAIHAGWRGTVGNIVGRAVQFMKERFSSNASDIVAFVGPSAGLCCYSVGEDVASQFNPAFVHRKNEKLYVDLKSANVAQLEMNGVPRASIEVSSLCTITEADTLHSFRRDKQQSGRMMGVIGLR